MSERRVVRAAAAPGAAPGMPAAEKTDGRVNRSIVTRKKIVDALTALIHEGQVAPTAELVAARADVGLRTVFRHFDDMDALYREISHDLEALIQPLLAVRLEGATWQQRLQHAVRLRTGFYDRVAAIHLATQVHRHASAYLPQTIQQFVELQRELLRRLLPPAVARHPTLFEALDVWLSIDTWIRLRREQALSGEAALEVVMFGVNAQLAASGLAPASPA